MVASQAPPRTPRPPGKDAKQRGKTYKDHKHPDPVRIRTGHRVAAVTVLIQDRHCGVARTACGRVLAYIGGILPNNGAVAFIPRGPRLTRGDCSALTAKGISPARLPTLQKCANAFFRHQNAVFDHQPAAHQGGNRPPRHLDSLIRSVIRREQSTRVPARSHAYAMRAGSV